MFLQSLTLIRHQNDLLLLLISIVIIMLPFIPLLDPQLPQILHKIDLLRSNPLLRIHNQQNQVRLVIGREGLVEHVSVQLLAGGVGGGLHAGRVDDTEEAVQDGGLFAVPGHPGDRVG